MRDGDSQIHSLCLRAQSRGAEVEDNVEVERIGELTLEGFQRPVSAFSLTARLRAGSGASDAAVTVLTCPLQVVSYNSTTDGSPQSFVGAVRCRAPVGRAG